MNYIEAEVIFQFLDSRIEDQLEPIGDSTHGKNYLGAAAVTGRLRAKNRKLIAREMKKKFELNFKQYERLLALLYSSANHHKIMAGELLKIYPQFRKRLSLVKLEAWLDNLIGWAEVDNTCQSSFSAKEMLERWPAWQELLKSLSRSKNINQRRSSLVLMVRAVRETQDERLLSLAFENIDALKKESPILLTKAVSWLLREMVKLNRKRVKTYIQENQDSLPAVAYRETTRKIETGRK